MEIYREECERAGAKFKRELGLAKVVTRTMEVSANDGSFATVF